MFLKRTRSSAVALVNISKGISDRESHLFYSRFKTKQKLHHNIIWIRISGSWDLSFMPVLHEILGGLGKDFSLHCVQMKAIFATKKEGCGKLDYYYQLFVPPYNRIIYHPSTCYVSCSIVLQEKHVRLPLLFGDRQCDILWSYPKCGTAPSVSVLQKENIWSQGAPGKQSQAEPQLTCRL